MTGIEIVAGIAGLVAVLISLVLLLTKIHVFIKKQKLVMSIKISIGGFSMEFVRDPSETDAKNLIDSIIEHEEASKKQDNTITRRSANE